MKVDVVIASKDRPTLLESAVEQARKLVLANKIIVVESSKLPNKQLLDRLNVTVVYTPNVKLGCARQTGLEKSSTENVLFVDDDITLEPVCFKEMWNTLEDSPLAVAVSGRVVYGWNSDPVLFKLTGRARIPRLGGSGGLVLLKRQKILELGGFNRTVHWGEDMELRQRIEKHGFQWVRSLNARGYHVSTLKHQITRSKRNAAAYKQLWRHGATLRSLLTKLLAKTFVLPIYYGLQLCDPRVSVYYFLMNLTLTLSFVASL